MQQKISAYLFSGSSSAEQRAMNLFTDHLGNIISLSQTPKRIISLVPSQTELLYDLGLKEEVVGITKFCVHPEEWFRTKTRIGGTKKINFEKIDELRPDLIIANKEENDEQQIKELQKKYPVWISNIQTIDDAFDMMRCIGIIVKRKTETERLITEIKIGLKTQDKRQKTALYFIWKEPYMIAGGDTFINEMMKLAGFKNAAENLSRYPALEKSEILNLKSEILLLSSEPFPFKEKHLVEMQEDFPDSKIILVDGEMFSWYGSRMKLAPEYFQTLYKHLKTD